MSNEKRKYEQTVRAEQQEETRRRIARATAELHEEVGPTQTTVAEIARRAGVRRPTVYNNFPTERELFAACQRHFFAEHPPPDPTEALAIEDPVARLESVLVLFYRWYRRTEAMSENVRRDRARLPALDALMAETGDVRVARLARALALGLAPSGRPRRELRASVALALDFWTWRRLTNEGLDDRPAARLMARTTAAAAG